MITIFSKFTFVYSIIIILERKVIEFPYIQLHETKRPLNAYLTHLKVAKVAVMQQIRFLLTDSMFFLQANWPKIQWTLELYMAFS